MLLPFGLMLLGSHFAVSTTLNNISMSKNTQLVHHFSRQLLLVLDSIESDLGNLGRLASADLLPDDVWEAYLQGKVEGDPVTDALWLLDSSNRVMESAVCSSCDSGTANADETAGAAKPGAGESDGGTVHVESTPASQEDGFIPPLFHADFIAGTREAGSIFWCRDFLLSESERPAAAAAGVFGDRLLIYRLNFFFFFSSLAAEQEFGYIFVMDRKGHIMAYPEEKLPRMKDLLLGTKDIRDFLKEPSSAPVSIQAGGDLFIFQYIERTGWTVGFHQDRYATLMFLRPFRLMSTGIAVLTLGVSLVMAAFALKETLVPLKQLMEATRRVSSGEYSVEIGYSRVLELSQLAERFRIMALAVGRREDELARMNANLDRMVDERTRKLEQTLATLRKTQKHLILTERMSGLGEMVAGMAHEINTPLGIAYTASTYMNDSVEEMDRLHSAGQIGDDSWEQLLEGLQEASHIVSKSLRRTAELVGMFKKVTVDQASEVKRTFNIKEYLHEVILVLKPRLKGVDMTFDIQAPDNFIIDSYPGPFSQIIGNLVINSVEHGFSGRSEGTVSIHVYRYEDSVDIVYYDDGVGMPPEVRRKVFDPFYTTGRSHGGSGLGMHVVYNLVTQLFLGSVECPERPQGGAEFRIRLPINP